MSGGYLSGGYLSGGYLSGGICPRITPNTRKRLRHHDAQAIETAETVDQHNYNNKFCQQHLGK